MDPGATEIALVGQQRVSAACAARDDAITNVAVGRIQAAAAGLPRPVVKWVGGKAKLADKLVSWMPERIGTYVEPFCGGGAVFFRLAAASPRRFDRAVLADKNEHLIALYRAVQSQVEALVEATRKLERHHLALEPEAREAHFYEVRNHEPRGDDDVGRGARLLFLNRTCYNGLWRENASGKNNVPYGRYKSPKILDVDALLAASRALRRVKLVVADFSAVTKKLRGSDFVYFDPPYVPVSKTANFTAYARDGFGPDAQARLRDLLGALGERGVGAMLSNAYTPETEELYAGFLQRRVPMPRAINSDPRGRGDVEELVVFNDAAARNLAARKVAS
jgi:DNA adenine methylase